MGKEHWYQLGGFVVAVVVAVTPLAVWVNHTSSVQATVLSVMARQDKDISEQRADQRLVTQNLIDVKTGFARIDATLESILREKQRR